MEVERPILHPFPSSHCSTELLSLLRLAPPTTSMSSQPDRTSFDKPEKVVYGSGEFYLGGGTVTIDLSSQKVLLIRLKEGNQYWKGSTRELEKRWELPRGRKNIGETVEQCAIRETREESGFEVTLLPVPLQTRATPVDKAHAAQLVCDGTRNIWSGHRWTEPFAQMLHYHPNSRAMTVASFFVAEGDSTAETSIHADEKYETKWVKFDKAEGMMMNEHFREVVKLGIGFAKKLLEPAT